MKMTAFWDIAPCSLIEADVSEVHTACIIRAIALQFVDLFMTYLHIQFYMPRSPPKWKVKCRFCATTILFTFCKNLPQQKFLTFQSSNTTKVSGPYIKWH
jgi:hypothetical protein